MATNDNNASFMITKKNHEKDNKRQQCILQADRKNHEKDYNLAERLNEAIEKSSILELKDNNRLLD